MNLKEAVKGMSVKDLREARKDLVIADAVPMQEAVDLVREGLGNIEGLSEDQRSALEGALEAPLKRDLVAEALAAVANSLTDLDADTREGVASLLKAAGEKLAVDIEIPEAKAEESEETETEEVVTSPVESVSGSDEGSEEESEEESTQESSTPDAGAIALQMVRAQRALDSALRESNLPDPVEADIRAALEGEIDAAAGAMTAESVKERVGELVAQSKRAAESWKGNVSGLGSSDENAGTSAEAREAAKKSAEKDAMGFLLG